MIVKVSQRGVTRLVEISDPATHDPPSAPRMEPAQIVHDYLSGVQMLTISLAYQMSINEVRCILYAGTTEDERRRVEAAHHTRRVREWLKKRGVNKKPGPRYRSVRR